MDGAAIREGLDRLDGGATNDDSEIYRGLSKAPLTRWREALGQRELALIARVTEPTAARLGYELEPAGGGAMGAVSAMRSPAKRWRAAARLAYAQFAEGLA